MAASAKRGDVVLPPPLPANIEDWTRYIKSERTLNDLVEDVHRILVPESERYRELLRATRDPQAVEGSLSMDNALVALMIREKAVQMENAEVATANLATINLALGVVLRRYHLSRKQRRNTVGGQEVPSERNNDD